MYLEVSICKLVGKFCWHCACETDCLASCFSCILHHLSAALLRNAKLLTWISVARPFTIYFQLPKMVKFYSYNWATHFCKVDSRLIIFLLKWNWQRREKKKKKKKPVLCLNFSNRLNSCLTQNNDENEFYGPFHCFCKCFALWLYAVQQQANKFPFCISPNAANGWYGLAWVQLSLNFSILCRLIP